MLRFKTFIAEAAKSPKKPKMSWTEKLVKQVKGIATKSKKEGAEEHKKKEKPIVTPGATVLVFGRMGPVTRGHEAVIDQAKKQAAKIGAKLKVVISHSTGTEHDPFDPEVKMRHIKRAFPDVDIELAGKDHPSLMHQVKKAYDDGTRDLTIIGGGDRAKHYQKLITNYNRTPAGGYNFKNIKVVSAGKRGPGIISATDQRTHALAGDFESFKAGLPSTIASNVDHAKELFTDTKKAMKKVTKKK